MDMQQQEKLTMESDKEADTIC